MMNVKVVIVGSGHVGKTSLLTSFTTNQCPDEYVPTVFDNYSASYHSPDHGNVNLGLWDTAGQEDYDRLRPLSYPNTDVVLLCYSTANRRSFEDITNKWMHEIMRHMPNAHIILVGTKTDLRDECECPVSTEDGQRMADLIKSIIGKTCPFHECSAQTQKGLRAIFDKSIELALNPPARPLSQSNSVKSAVQHTVSSLTGLVSALFTRVDSFKLQELPDSIKYQIVSNITDAKDRSRFAATSYGMHIMDFITQYNNLHRTKLTETQMQHLYSCRVRANGATSRILLEAAQNSACPVDATDLQRKAVAHGATWSEVATREITPAHIDALCCVGNQEMIRKGRMTVTELLDQVDHTIIESVSFSPDP